MKKLFTYLSILSLILFVFSLAYAETPPQPKDQLQSPVDKDKLKQIKPIPSPKCPDPAVQRIDFAIVSKTSQFSGKVRVIGIVKNLTSSFLGT